ncbi:MAG: ribonuclease HII [Saprospiraceae bacterium]|nr:ribonuclease HII [Saprospiraceae bacterium]
MLQKSYSNKFVEAGCDEAGRGCLAGPVVAAAVILPKNFNNNLINDSKKLNEKSRNKLRLIIENEALAWAVAFVDNHKIDEINILNASFLAMHKAIEKLTLKPELLLIDGNRFKKYSDINHLCIIKGDAKFQSIAAASILAKTHRDEFMSKIHLEHPYYDWISNKGYPTPKHKASILEFGQTSYHRLSFRIKGQLKLDLN